MIHTDGIQTIANAPRATRKPVQAGRWEHVTRPLEGVPIDDRLIPGNGGEVTWSTLDDEHVVTVYGPEGDTLAYWVIKDGKEAFDAFWHPFARPDVADVFKASR